MRKFVFSILFFFTILTLVISKISAREKFVARVLAESDSVSETSLSEKVVFSNSFLWLIPLVLLVFALIKWVKIPKWCWVSIFLGSLFFSVPMIRSGTIESWGMGFWGPNGHDGVWHLSLINQSTSFPIKNPVFSGETLSGYHWGFDFLAGLVSRLFFLPTHDVYFKLLPIIFAILIGLFSFILAKKISGKWSTGFWFMFFNYFAGSLGWLVSFIKDRSFGGESLFWAMQSISTLINPPYAFSLIVLLAGLIIWIDLDTLKGKVRRKRVLILAVLFGLLTLIKIYAAILVGLSLFFFWLRRKFILKSKEASTDFLLLVSMAAVSFFCLLIMGIFSARPSLVFKPFWFTHSLIESLDKLYWPRLATLRINLVQQMFSIKLPVLLAIEGILLLVFLVGNLGARIFAVGQMLKRFLSKRIKRIDVFAVPFLLFSFLMPTLFVQGGTTWNTIQFFYYFLIFANLYLALTIDQLFASKGKKAIFAFLILAILLPTTFSTLKGYFGTPPPAAIPNHELRGLSFLKGKPSGTVLTYPYGRFHKEGLNTPIPLYLYETTGYVSAFANKISFLEDEMNLEITGFDWKTRRGNADKFFTTKDLFWARGFLVNNQINYIYLVNDQKFLFQEVDLGIKMIFNNGQVRIYQVLR